jgi:hypothetical protein
VIRVLFELLEAVEVMFADEEVEVIVATYAVPVERRTVTVEAGPVKDEELLELEVMWNGNEYWKIVGSVSREILIP